MDGKMETQIKFNKDRRRIIQHQPQQKQKTSTNEKPNY